ncbi:hypothetical protein [Haloglomus litoreum]|uniref:hypothetical protein n=1 Tax=Haloglomus litoreum TaxID=3034026 RepID=UPI0023E7EEFB|nr:hypothetical protein [Haloglomus sp. DT116]
MAERQGDDTDEKVATTGQERGGKGSFSRRSLLKATGVAAVGVGLSQALGSVSAATRVNLGDEGLAPGDEIDPYLEEFFEDGNEVVIPAGEYEWNGDGIGGSFADAGLVGDGQVVLRHPDGMHRAPTTRATGGTVEFRNITIRGECDGNDSRWRLEAASDADLVLENVALPDGMEGQFGDATGIYVPPDHAGTLTLRNVHLEDFSNNGLYASAPGKPSDGQQGPVYVEGGLYKNNNVAGVRLGSNNSHAIGVTIVNDAESTDIGDDGTAQRGLRIREPGDDMLVEDCDIYHSWDGAASPIQMHPEADGTSGVFRDVRVYNNSGATAISGDTATDGWTSEGISITGDGDLSYPSSLEDVCVGDSCPTADPDPSDGTDGDDSTSTSTPTATSTPTPTPTATATPTPTATATPTDDGSTDGGSTDGGSSGGSDTTGRLFVVEAVDGGPKFSYEFTATGPVTKVQDGSTLEADGNDTITDNGDGTFTVTGETGNGYGDSFRVEGEFAGFGASTDADNYTLLLDGDEVTADMLGGGGDDDPAPASTRLEIVAVESGPKFSYEFTTDGEPTKAADGTRLKAEGNDTITDNGDGTYTVAGVTGNGYGDSFDLTGEVTAFTASTEASNYVLRYDGAEVTVDELVAGPDLPNTISFDGMGSGDPATYRFEVSGEVSAGTGDSLESEDTISGTVVEGTVETGTDTYRFSGDLLGFDLEGSALATIEATE